WRVVPSTGNDSTTGAPAARPAAGVAGGVGSRGMAADASEAAASATPRERAMTMGVFMAGILSVAATGSGPLVANAKVGKSLDPHPVELYRAELPFLAGNNDDPGIVAGRERDLCVPAHFLGRRGVAI